MIGDQVGAVKQGGPNGGVVLKGLAEQGIPRITCGIESISPSCVIRCPQGQNKHPMTGNKGPGCSP